MTIDKKPLELRVFDNIARHAEGWEIASDSAPVRTWRTIPIGMADALTRGKRLTPAECAAEYWRNESDTWEAHEFGSYGMLHESWPNEAEDCSARAKVLARFATLPHAAETEYK